MVATALQRYRGFPIVCVGSGGSLTTAHFAAALHQEFAGQVSRAATPLDAVAMPLDWKAAAALIFTAGGGNPDAVGCFRHLVRREVGCLGVVCCRAGGPILAEAAGHPAVDQFLIAPPSGKDGFLATNTLLASVVVLTRAFAEAAGRSHGLPLALAGLFPDEGIGCESAGGGYAGGSPASRTGHVGRPPRPDDPTGRGRSGIEVR